MEKISKCIKRRAFNNAVGPKKNPKLINIGPTFIPDYRVAKKLVVKIFVTTYRYSKYLLLFLTPRIKTLLFPNT